MSDEPQYKLVNGELVQLTPEEIAAREAEQSQQQRSQAIAQPKFDMGQSMNEILTG